MVLLSIDRFKRVSHFRPVEGDRVARNFLLMAGNRREVFAARDDGIANDASAVAVDGGDARLRLNYDFRDLLNGRYDRVVAVFVRQGTSVILFRFVFFDLYNGDDRHFRNFCQVFAVDHFATRRRDVDAVVSDVDGVDCLHADQAQVVGRDIGRLYHCGGQLLYRRTFAGRYALSAQGAFL